MRPPLFAGGIKSVEVNMEENIITINRHEVRSRSLGRTVLVCQGYPNELTYPDGSKPDLAREFIEARGLPEGNYHGLYLVLCSELRNDENNEFMNPHIYISHAERITMQEARNWKPSRQPRKALQERGTSQDSGPITQAAEGAPLVADDDEPF